MRSTAIGLVMLNDERPHVHRQNEAQTMAVLHRWADVLRPWLRNRDGTSPEIVVGAETIKSVRSAHEFAFVDSEAGVIARVIAPPPERR
jgi:L-fucose/D-arabinose isomerase